MGVDERRPNALRQRNLHQVLAAVRQRGPVTQAEIVATTELSRSTVSSILAELRGAGMIEPVGSGGRSALGRPAEPITLRRDHAAVIGVDFGHTHVQVAVADLGMTVLARRFRDVAVDREADPAILAATEMVAEVLDEAGVDRRRVLGVGIGVPGPVDQGRGRVGSSTIMPGWVGVAVGEQFASRLELPVEIDNDANLGALAELACGAAAGLSNVVYIKASTGIGAGLVIGGVLLRGASGTAGEIGHMTIDEAGELCYCGNRGCLETVAGAPAILRQVGRTRPGLTFTRLLALAAGGDIVCRRALADAGRQIGVAVANVCNLVNPERVVVGGLLSRASDVVIESIRDSVNRSAVDAAADRLQIVPAELGDRAELTGALALVARGSNPVFADRLLRLNAGRGDEFPATSTL